VTPRRILVGGWLVFLLYCYPGFMLTESADQLIDSRYGEIQDVHSAVMTKLWGLVEIVIAGPAGMLFLQSLLLLLGAYFLLRHVLSDRAAAVGAVVMLLLPPLAATTSIITPEAQLASFLVAAMAAMASDRLRTRCIGIALAIIAAGMRDGGAVAAAVATVALFRWAKPRYDVAIGAAVFVVVAAFALNLWLPTKRTERGAQKLAMSDIVGTLNYESTRSDADIAKLLDGVPRSSEPNVQARAKAIYGQDRLYASGDSRVFDPIVTDAQRDALEAARGRVIRDAPASYLRHRLRSFNRVLGLTRSRAWRSAFTRHGEGPSDYKATNHLAHASLLQRQLMRFFTLGHNTFLFRPYFFGLLLFPMFIFAVLRRERLATLLLATGLAYELALFFVATRMTYRDSHVLAVMTVLGIVTLIASQAGWRRSASDCARG
jgi:4-amino-4-deoxy-L-arabinose transferase-like glycosyltransferase